MTKRQISRRGFMALTGTMAATAVPTLARADEIVSLDDEGQANSEDPDVAAADKDAQPAPSAEETAVPESADASETGLGLLVAALPTVVLGEDEQIALLGEDDFGTLVSGSLTVSHASSGEERDLKFENVADNAALVSLSYGDASMAGDWSVVKASMTWEDGRETIFVPSEKAPAPTFTFLAAEASREEDGQTSTAEDPAYVVKSDAGTITAESSLEAAVETSETDQVAASEQGAGYAPGDAVMTAAVYRPGAARYAQTVTSPSRPVALDPGHGGTDSGAVGNGLRECDLNWKIMKYCAERLGQLKVPYTIVVKESEFKTASCPVLSRKERVDRALAAHANAVVSFHINSGGGQGALVMVPTSSSYGQEVYQSGQQFGNRVLSKLKAVGMIGPNNTLLSSKTYDDYGILYYSGKNGILGVIIEHGFIDNAHDAMTFKSETALKNMGYKDAEAIKEQWYSGAAKTPIMGASYTNREALSQWFATMVPNDRVAPYKAKGGINNSKEFGYAIWDQACAEGVRPEVLMAQVAVETGWLKFGGAVDKNACNFGGIGAVDSSPDQFNWFSTAQQGLLAQAQHLKAYASTDPLNKTCVDPRFRYVTRGCAPYVEDLSGKWASDSGYGAKIAGIVGQALAGADAQRAPYLTYEVHQQSYGWESTVGDNGIAGVTGQAKRLEALRMWLPAGQAGSIKYQAHVQSIGWQGAKANGQIAGTTGQAKRIEALKVWLEGDAAAKYDVWYRVHCQTYGWTGWATAGKPAGTQGLAKRVEAIQVTLRPKGSAAPGSTANAFRYHAVAYRTHVQTYGWQGDVYDGAVSGTVGRAKRLEGIQIHLPYAPAGGGIEYRTHVQTYGWEKGWKANGQTSGTTGQAKRLEAIQIRLTGGMAEKYDVYYRVHCQTFGWMGWAKNGESAGSEGYAKRLEGIQIRIVPKGAAAPGSTAGAYRTR